ncbi:type IV secretion system protein VirB2 [Pseudomonas sp. PSPC3-3]|uniref:type IV secretion system protein VirB2 n=1 Tax=unclassified Pseudomonas TaxID=196821 RepID=UPI003CEB3E9F
MLNRKKIVGLVGFLVCLMPMVAMADDWAQTLVTQGRNVRIGLYAIAGSMALGSLVYTGIRWLAARTQGDHSTTFMTYLEQVGVIIVVGGAIALGAGAWQIFGSGNPT